MEGMRNFFKGFGLSFQPRWMQKLIEINALIEKEIYLTEKMIGKEKTAKLVNQFKNEAYAQKGVNSDYIIRKLTEVRKLCQK